MWTEPLRISEQSPNWPRSGPGKTIRDVSALVFGVPDGLHFEPYLKVAKESAALYEACELILRDLKDKAGIEDYKSSPVDWNSRGSRK